MPKRKFQATRPRRKLVSGRTVRKMKKEREPKLKGKEKKAFEILKKGGFLASWTLVEDLKISCKEANRIIKSLTKKGIIKLENERM